MGPKVTRSNTGYGLNSAIHYPLPQLQVSPPAPITSIKIKIIEGQYNELVKGQGERKELSKSLLGKWVLPWRIPWQDLGGHVRELEVPRGHPQRRWKDSIRFLLKTQGLTTTQTDWLSTMVGDELKPKLNIRIEYKSGCKKEINQS